MSVVYLGLIISTFFGVAKVMMAELCPEGEENEWFSLFQLADKGSSWYVKKKKKCPIISNVISDAIGFRASIGKLHCPDKKKLFFLHHSTQYRIGPFATGAIQALTGEFRPGFWFPLALFVVGRALLFTVDMNKGKDEAARYTAGQEAKRRLLASIPPITITSAGESPFFGQECLVGLANK